MKLFELFWPSVKKQLAELPGSQELVGLTSGEIQIITTNVVNLVEGKQCWEYADKHKDDMEIMMRYCENQMS